MKIEDVPTHALTLDVRGREKQVLLQNKVKCK